MQLFDDILHHTNFHTFSIQKCNLCRVRSQVRTRDFTPGVEFRREQRESIRMLLSGVCESLWPLFHSVCVKLLTVYESLTGFSQINLASVFKRVDSQTRIKILALYPGSTDLSFHAILYNFITDNTISAQYMSFITYTISYIQLFFTKVNQNIYILKITYCSLYDIILFINMVSIQKLEILSC